MTIPLLSSSYFVGELLIPGVAGTTDAEIANAFELQQFINEYEEEFLRHLLGDDCYDEFAAGITAGVAKWTALKDEIYWQKSYNQTQPVNYSDISADASFADCVPAGYILEYVVFDNSSGTAAVLSMGSTAGAVDLFESWGINANGLTSIPIGRALSMVAASTLYLHDGGTGDTWNGAVLDVYLVLSSLGTSVPAASGTTTVLLYSPAANYVYYKYKLNSLTTPGVSGESKDNQENAANASATHKLVRAWNKMVDWVIDIRDYIENDGTYDYDTYECDEETDIFEKINQWGI